MTAVEAQGYTGTVILDGGVLTLRRSGLRARATVGRGDKRIPIRNVTAVQWKPAGRMVNGYIEFTLLGGVEFRGRAGSATTGAASNENAVVFTRKQMPAFEALRAAVEQAMGVFT